MGRGASRRGAVTGPGVSAPSSAALPRCALGSQAESQARSSPQGGTGSCHWPPRDWGACGFHSIPCLTQEGPALKCTQGHLKCGAQAGDALPFCAQQSLGPGTPAGRSAPPRWPRSGWWQGGKQWPSSAISLAFGRSWPCECSGGPLRKLSPPLSMTPGTAEDSSRVSGGDGHSCSRGLLGRRAGPPPRVPRSWFPALQPWRGWES